MVRLLLSAREQQFSSVLQEQFTPTHHSAYLIDNVGVAHMKIGSGKYSCFHQLFLLHR